MLAKAKAQRQAHVSTSRLLSSRTKQGAQSQGSAAKRRHEGTHTNRVWGERERERDREGLTHAITAAEKPLDAWAGGRGRRR